MHHDTDAKASPAGPALAALGGLLVVVGSFLTWATLKLDASSLGGGTESQSVQGWDASDGKISLAIGVILLIAGLVAYSAKAAGGRRGMGILAIIAGVAAIGLGIFEVTDIKKDLDALIEGLGLPEGVASHSIGIGLWIIIAGGVIGLIGGVMAMASAKRMPAAAGATASGFSAAPPPPGMTGGTIPPAPAPEVPPAPAAPAPPAVPPAVPPAPAPTEPVPPAMPASGAMGVQPEGAEAQEDDTPGSGV